MFLFVVYKPDKRKGLDAIITARDRAHAEEILASRLGKLADRYTLFELGSADLDGIHPITKQFTDDLSKARD